MTQISVIGEVRYWPNRSTTTAIPEAVKAVSECPGWVFVMPSRAGRPFSISYAVWVELPHVR
jgi:hypothetical protein